MWIREDEEKKEKEKMIKEAVWKEIEEATKKQKEIVSEKEEMIEERKSRRLGMLMRKTKYKGLGIGFPDQGRLKIELEKKKRCP